MAYPTQDRIRELFDYNAETGLFIRRISRGNSRAGAVAGSLDRNGYVYIAIDKKDYAAHRLAWIYVHGPILTGEIDHINNVKNDNRLANLRIATHSQNCANAPVRSHSKSGYKGVTFRRGKWIARLVCVEVKKHIGTFDTPEEAQAAYMEEARRIFGEFAKLG